MKNPHSADLMIYGANGYTGRLITQMAVQRGLRPLLCGRNSLEIATMASQYNLPYMVVDLNNADQLNDAVLMVDVVLHCAGPFSKTYQPILQACCKNKTHYLDITGEIEVFEGIAAQDMAIQAAGIMAVPGVGFDVVPTDCLAAFLKQQLPSATHLTLAFMGVGGGVSHGTATTMLQNIERGGAVRLDGRITPVPHLYRSRDIVFNKKSVKTFTIPWGDVSTAYHSTGIPNIEVYVVLGSMVERVLGLTQKMNWLLKRQFIKNLLQKAVNAQAQGPTDQQRAKGKSFVWGEVVDANNNRASARLITPEGYTLTALAALAAVEQVLKGNIKVGFQTPSRAFGADFVLTLPNTTRELLSNKKNITIN